MQIIYKNKNLKSALMTIKTKELKSGVAAIQAFQSYMTKQATNPCSQTIRIDLLSFKK